ncbi:MAG: tRNA glutamyl-Q(34) synthetase GluQRS [Aquabacterium sp.]|uniref:tRNA glutamyl-Q(34) synthetase GluQRS n=1 Tax=Aquabacterium sp. TaxID=1872578 RepID=UPI00271596D6|nr:tRNA glutamyl-Q(34) synthetase GluQRS [Aquabacterium sp.]MDO9006176.1 tRNA glutamyl-Q(34) synthetase GluQRS [Aquabacterium sp.]
MNAPAPGVYIGRFAPSPTGPLHAGSLVAALASWLDARAHGGRWLVRIEDVDTPRCVPGADQVILGQLAALGLVADEPPVYQSQRGPLYQAALGALVARNLAYPCACTRADIAQANAALGLLKPRHGELVYPGTCRPENGGLRGRAPRAWRLRVPHGSTARWDWHDRRLGAQTQALDSTVGDFVIRRADGLWAYQLAVVVDDAEQHITHVVRGEDLADNTPRQQWLQQCLGVPTPSYLHTPLVVDAHGEKLSKQHGAPAVQASRALSELRRAGQSLGIEVAADSVEGWLKSATLYRFPD